MSNPLLGLLAQNNFDRDGAQSVNDELDKMFARLGRSAPPAEAPTAEDGLSMAEAFAKAGLGKNDNGPRAEVKRLARMVEKQQGWEEGSFVGPALKAMKRLQRRLDKKSTAGGKKA